MKRIIAILALFIACACGRAATVQYISGTLTVTNNTAAMLTNGLNYTLKGSIVYSTNTANSDGFFLTNTAATGLTTNIFNQFAAYPKAGVSMVWSSPTSVIFRGFALTLSANECLGTVSLSTNTSTNSYAVMVPFTSSLYATNWTNTANELVIGMSTYATNRFQQTDALLDRFVSLQGVQTISNKSFAITTITGGTNTGAKITNALSINGTVYFLTNGVWTNAFLQGPTLTNGVNYGNAFSSRGSGTDGSQAFGPSGLAAGAFALAISGGDEGASAAGTYSVAIGNDVGALGYADTAIGAASQATSGNSVALGATSYASATNATALGKGASAGHINSTALGYSAATTDSNQVRVGTATVSASILNDAHIGDNLSVGNDWAVFVNSLAKGIAITNGTAAAANPTNGAALWVASGELQYRTSATSEGAGGTMRVHNRAAYVAGGGTDFTIAGTVYARIDFGGQDPEIALPTAGTYVIRAQVAIVAGAVGNDQFNVKFYNSTDAADVTDSDRRNSNITALTEQPVDLEATVTVTAGKTIQLYIQNATLLRGSVAAARTRISYVRLY